MEMNSDASTAAKRAIQQNLDKTQGDNRGGLQEEKLTSVAIALPGELRRPVLLKNVDLRHRSRRPRRGSIPPLPKNGRPNGVARRSCVYGRQEGAGQR